MTEQYTLQKKDVPTPQPVQPPVSDKPNMPKQTLRLLIGGGLLLLFITFFSGFFLRGLFIPQSKLPLPTPVTNPSPLATPGGQTPTPSNTSEIPASSIQFLPGKQYFEDTYAIISKKQPYHTLILSVARIEQERNYAQYTKVNFFDGQVWQRKAVTTTITNPNVVTNPLLRLWNTTAASMQDPLLASIMIEDTELSFGSSLLQNEISIESLPGSTKFIYQGTGTLTINGEEENVYVLRTRSYSFNAIDLAFFNTPENLTSNFISFWDEEGEFYYVDTHTTKNPTTPIQTRTIAVKENTRKIVSKAEQLSSEFQQKDGVNEFVVRLQAPINEQLRLIFVRALDKAKGNTYTWTLSNVTGSSVKAEGRTVKGVGIVEYIRPAR